MANPRNPALASFPIPPPLPNWPLVDDGGMATPAFAQFLQFMWAAIQGTGGVVDTVTTTIFQESPTFSPDVEVGKRPILAEMPESRPVLEDRHWLIAERSYGDLYRRISNVEILASLGSASSSKVSDIKGTANQVIVSTAAGVYTLSTPQDIATASTVQFGAVGIGTAATHQLDIRKDQAATTIATLNNANASGAVSYQIVTDVSGGTCTWAALGSAAGGTTYGGVTGNSQILFESASASSFYIGTTPACPILFAQNRVEKMRLDNNGNLGIGMTPANILDITQTQNAGSVISLFNDSTGGSASCRVFLTNHSGSTGAITMYGSGFASSGLNLASGLLIQNNGAGGITLVTIVNQPIYFGINGVETFRLDGSRATSQLPINLKNYTVSTLPAGTRGDIAYVTDATAPTYLGTLTGGGAIVTPVFYNGAAWVSF